MHTNEFWKLVSWTCLCIGLLFAGRVVSQWTKAEPIRATISFESGTSIWEEPSTPNKIQRIRVPVKISPRMEQEVPFSFRLNLPILPELEENHPFRLLNSNNAPYLEGDIVIPAGLERVWISFPFDYAQIAETQKLKFELIPSEAWLMGAHSQHLAELLPAFDWQWDMTLDRTLKGSEFSLSTNQIKDITSTFRFNRNLAPKSALKLSALTSEGAKDISEPIPDGALSVKLDEPIKRLLGEKQFGRVELTLAFTDLNGKQVLGQKWLAFPPPKYAKLSKLNLARVGDETVTENGGPMEFEITGDFSEGLSEIAKIDFQLDGLVVGDDYEVIQDTIELSPEKRSHTVIIRWIDDKIPEASKAFEVLAQSDSTKSAVIKEKLVDDDPLELEWSEKAGLVITEGASPAAKLFLTTKQESLPSKFSLQVSMEPNVSKHLSVNPSTIQIGSGLPKASIEIFCADDEVLTKLKPITLSATLVGSNIPSAGLRLNPLTLTVVDNDMPKPMPMDENLGILVVYNDYLKRNWEAKQTDFANVLAAVKKENLVRNDLLLVGGNGEIVPLQEELPESFSVAEFSSYAEMLTSIEKTIAEIAAGKQTKHFAVLWFAESELEDSTPIVTNTDTAYRTHLFWMDGNVASTWLFSNFGRPWLKKDPKAEPLLFYPADVSQREFVSKLREYVDSPSSTP